jgi:prevent-host-death family protein
MPHEIVVHELAVKELASLRAYDRRRVLAEIRGELTDQPTVATRRRKCLVDLTPSFDHELGAKRGHLMFFSDMKTIPARDLQTNLDAVLNSSQKERIVIYREGKPCAVLVGIQDYDAEDLQLATSSDFWLMIRQRRADGRSIPLAEVESQLASRRRKASAQRPVSRKPQPPK